MSVNEVGIKPESPLSEKLSQEAGAPAEKIYRCDLCGAPMLDLHCKLICRRCGFKRDCSDP